MCREEAARLGLKDQDRIQVAAHSADRQMVFQNVVVRVSPTYRLEMHLDTDEGNAAGLRSGDHVAMQLSTNAAATSGPRPAIIPEP
jgi:propanediol utilization protein